MPGISTPPYRQETEEEGDSSSSDHLHTPPAHAESLGSRLRRGAQNTGGIFRRMYSLGSGVGGGGGKVDPTFHHNSTNNRKPQHRKPSTPPAPSRFAATFPPYEDNAGCVRVETSTASLAGVTRCAIPPFAVATAATAAVSSSKRQPLSPSQQRHQRLPSRPRSERPAETPSGTPTRSAASGNSSTAAGPGGRKLSRPVSDSNVGGGWMGLRRSESLPSEPPSLPGTRGFAVSHARRAAGASASASVPTGFRTPPRSSALAGILDPLQQSGHLQQNREQQQQEQQQQDRGPRQGESEDGVILPKEPPPPSPPPTPPGEGYISAVEGDQAQEGQSKQWVGLVSEHDAGPTKLAKQRGVDDDPIRSRVFDGDRSARRRSSGGEGGGENNGGAAVVAGPGAARTAGAGAGDTSRSISPPTDTVVEALRMKVQALNKSKQRLRRRISRRDNELSELKARTQFYRERLSVYEAPLPTEEGLDRRTRARNWLRSSSARRRTVAGDGPERSDSDPDMSNSGTSRSVSPNRIHRGFGLSGLDDLSRSETSSTLTSTPGSLRSRISVTPGGSSHQLSSVPSSAAVAAVATGATTTTVASSESAPKNGPATAGGVRGSVLVPPPITKIRLPPTFSKAPSSLPSYSGSAKGAAGAGPGGAAGGLVPGSVSCIGVAVGGLTRKSSRNRMPPVVPGWEPEDQAERDREERAAVAVQAAAARATWVFEGDDTAVRAASLASLGSVGTGFSQDGMDASTPQQADSGGASDLSCRDNSYMYPSSSAFQASSKRRSFSLNSSGGYGLEAAMYSVELGRPANTRAPSSPPTRPAASGGRESMEGRRGEQWPPDVPRGGADRLPSSVGEDSRTHDNNHDVGGDGVSQSAELVGGAAAAAEPKTVRVDQKELFLPNLVMEFGDDSPAFRRKVEALDSNVEGLRGQLQQLVAVARKYCGSGFAFCEHGRELAGVLKNTRGESWFTRLGALAPALESLGHVLEDIQSLQEETLLQPLENAFYPMEEFVKREVKTIRKMKQEMHRSCEDHESSMARFLQLKRNSEETVTQAKAAEVALSKRRFEMARFDLVHHLSQLETKKKHQVVGRTCTALYAFMALFRQSNDLVGSAEQNLRELEYALNLSQQDLEQEEMVWLARREELEASLNKTIPANATLVARHGAGSSSMLPAPSPTPSNASAASAFLSTWPLSAPSSISGSFAKAGGGTGTFRVSPAAQGVRAPATTSSIGGGQGRPLTAQAAATAAATAAAAVESAGVSAATVSVPSPVLGPAAGAGAGAAMTPMRTAQKRAVSLAARLAGSVAGGGGSGMDYGGGGGRGGGAFTPSPHQQQHTTPSYFSSSLTARSRLLHGFDGTAKDGGVGVSGTSTEGPGYTDGGGVTCNPSPVPSTGSATTGRGGKRSVIWGTGDGAGISDVDDDDFDDDDEEFQHEDGGGRGGGEPDRGAREGRYSVGSGGAFSGGALWSPRHDRCVKGGYLWKRSTNVRKDWQRRYFFIQNGKLFYQRQESFVSPSKRVCDIKLCHVRSCLKDTDLRFSFEIISPQRRTYLLQAEDEESHQHWVAVIKSEIERLLSLSQPASAEWDRPSPQSSIGTSTAAFTPAAERGLGEGAEGPMPADISLNKAQLTSLSEANPECVDCGAREPDWSSINLGVMMCIQCSGIHRSMGVHVSKVRSLTLDRWTTPLVELLLEAGNRNANKVWEASCGSNPSFSAMKAKMHRDADYATRDAFIRSKYEQRRFLDPPYDPSPEAALSSSRLLFGACKNGDMLGALSCLARGADVNWANAEANGCTAAHEAARGSRVALLELLANNGCNLGAMSDNQETPLDLAGQSGSRAANDAKVVRLLLSKQSLSQSYPSAQAGGGAAGAAAAAAKVAQALQQQ